MICACGITSNNTYVMWYDAIYTPLTLFSVNLIFLFLYKEAFEMQQTRKSKVDDVQLDNNIIKF